MWKWQPALLHMRNEQQLFNIQVSLGPLGCKKGSVHVEYRIIQLSVLDKLFKCPMT